MLRALVFEPGTGEHYRSSDNTFCWLWFAWLSMAVDAWLKCQDIRCGTGNVIEGSAAVG